MIKLTANFDNKAVESFIEELKKEYPEYEINVNNANDFSIALSEKKNCALCKGLANCCNQEAGYCYSYDKPSDSFVYNTCKFKQIENAKNRGLIKTLYLPEKILEADLTNYDIKTESRKRIYKYITEYVQGNIPQNKGLYIYGGFSIGKTYSLACLANELARNNIPCLLIYFPDLVVDLKDALSTPRFSELINMLKTVDVLMLDDLGSENMTPWLRDEVLGPVLNYRSLEGKPLFVSSNIAPEDLIDNFVTDKASNLKAERVVSRLKAAISETISMDDGKKYKR